MELIGLLKKQPLHALPRKAPAESESWNRRTLAETMSEKAEIYTLNRKYYSDNLRKQSGQFLPASKQHKSFLFLWPWFYLLI